VLSWCSIEGARERPLTFLERESAGAGAGNRVNSFDGRLAGEPCEGSTTAPCSVLRDGAGWSKTACAERGVPGQALPRALPVSRPLLSLLATARAGVHPNLCTSRNFAPLLITVGVPA
jgi:hypothetical protein